MQQLSPQESKQLLQLISQQRMNQVQPPLPEDLVNRAPISAGPGMLPAPHSDVGQLPGLPPAGAPSPASPPPSQYGLGQPPMPSKSDLQKAAMKRLMGLSPPDEELPAQTK